MTPRQDVGAKARHLGEKLSLQDITLFQGMAQLQVTQDIA